MVALLEEGQFDVVIPALNRRVDQNQLYPFPSKLSAVCSDISNAILGFKDHNTTRIVLDERMGVELSKFGPLLKMRQRMSYEHELVQALATDLFFRQTDYMRNERGPEVRRNATSTAEEDLREMALRMNPYTIPGLYLS